MIQSLQSLLQISFQRLFIHILITANLAGLPSAFNVDYKVPLIKTGLDNSYFGFSVSQHYINNTGQFVILVGAPKAIKTATRFSQPGALYNCPLTSSPCSLVNIDTTEFDSNEINKTDQWLGVSVSSQHVINGAGKAVVCAHRFREVLPGHECGYGICYNLENDLSDFNFLEPCKGSDDLCMCQAGIDTDVDQDGEVFVGAPSAHDGQGLAFKNNLERTMESDNDWYTSSKEDMSVQLYSYAGMSVKFGNIISGKKTYIVGAPKSKDRGEIFLFDLVNKTFHLKQKHRLLGEQAFSGFGYDIAVGDFNSDGWDDLVVGAPFYNQPGIGGAIYIYKNSAKGITSATIPTKITSRKMKDADCSKTSCHNARFGFSLANIRDIDKDGYPDLAVGAPYENEGQGAVYIFRGSHSSVISPEYSQRIEGASVSVSSTFGYSLAGGYDLDKNDYPDFVVGAYQSDKVVVMRSRPVVTITATLSSKPKVINPKQKNCTFQGKSINCFNVTACFQFRAEPKDRFKTKLNIRYYLEADVSATSIRRVFFADPVKSKTILRNQSMIIQEQNKEGFSCINQTLYLDPNAKDFLHPVALQLSYDLTDSRPPLASSSNPMPELYGYPALNQVKDKVSLNVDFVKNCGSDEICHAELILACSLSLKRDAGGEYALPVGVGTEELKIDITVKNKNEDAHESMLYVFLPENLDYIGTTNEVLCQPDEGLLSCDIGNPLGKDESVFFSVRLNPSKLTSSQDKIAIKLIVNTTSTENDISDNEEEFQIKVTTEADLFVKGLSNPNSIYFTSTSFQQEILNFEDIGPKVEHVYEIKNLGRVAIERSSVTFSWPWKLQDNSYLFYIMDVPEIKGPGSCDLDRNVNTDFIDPKKFKKHKSVDDTSSNKLNQSETRHQRRRRSASSGDAYELKCGDRKVFCYEFKCQINTLKPGESVVISINSRFWNQSFQQNFPVNAEISVFSKAKVEIDPSLKIIQIDTTNDIAEAVTKLLVKEHTRSVPWWVYFLAIFAGILLLILCIFILWKIGFFKRNKVEQWQYSKATKIEAQSSVDNDKKS